MLQAEKHIDLDALREWTQSWDELIYMDYFDHQIQDRIKRLKVRSSMEENIVKIKKLCADMGENFHFHAFLQLMDRIVFNCYFKVGNSALRIANYYEEILVPADQTTRNRLFGFRNGQRATGHLDVNYKGQTLGHMGEQSDMFHLIFDACFLTEDELFDEDELLGEGQPNPISITGNDDTLLTLKIWRPDLLDIPLDDFVDLFLYHCSTQQGLNFKRASFEAPLDRRSEPIASSVEVQVGSFEKLPLLSFNSAAHNLPPQIVFMSYYHTISHFFERAVQRVIREKMQSMFDEEDVEDSLQLRRMAKAVTTLRESYSEKEALSLVLKPVMQMEAFVRWLDAQPARKRWFTQAQERHKEVPLLALTSEKNLVRSLVDRMYAIKATIEAAHDKRDRFIWLSSLDDRFLQRDIPLIKLLATWTLEGWSEVQEL